MGAPQIPKQIDEDDCVPHVAVVEESRQQPERKLERRRAPGGPRRRGLENELEGERRRPRRKPRKRFVLCLRRYNQLNPIIVRYVMGKKLRPCSFSFKVAYDLF